MIPASFAYQAVDSVEEAAALLAEHGDEAKLLAGGQSLLPLLKLRFASPGLLVDLGKVAALRTIDQNGSIRIGAMATHHQLGRDRSLEAKLPIIHDAAVDIADPLVRNRGTFGGSLAHADPAGDWPAVALALGATLHAASTTGSRTIGIDDFFTGVFTSALAENEVLTLVEVPNPGPATRSAYVKLPNPASGYAVAGAAVVVEVSAGVVTAARIAMTGVAAVPYRAAAAEALLVGQPPSAAAIADAAALVADGVDALSDGYAPGPYRAHLATVVARRALEKALAF